ncbi:MAG: tetratricopeptide repeat protein [Ardenticatenales bacterium]|nr:tetratricopeptide repeat protein [Ardenticatenales bacterium]
MAAISPIPLSVEPVLSYPREAQTGKQYLMTIDFRHNLIGDDWPYTDEEYPIYCMVDAAPLFTSKPVGGPAVILHRFGGSYGPARFVLTASSSEQVGTIKVTLVNGERLPMRVLELSEIVVHEQIVETNNVNLPKLILRTDVARASYHQIDQFEAETDQVDSGNQRAFYEDFASLLNRYLFKLDRSLAWLARRLGVSSATVSRWSSGQTLPRDLKMVYQICDILNIQSNERETLFAAAGFIYTSENRTETTDFAVLLTQYLNQRGRSQRWLANQLDISSSTVARWCLGMTLPKNLTTVYEICYALEVDAEARSQLLFASGYTFLPDNHTETRQSDFLPQEKNLNSTFGILLRQKLFHLDRSKLWLASRLHVHHTTIDRYITGKSFPPLELVSRMCDILRITDEEREQWIQSLLSDLNVVLQRDPTNATVHKNLGIVLHQQGKLSEAVVAFQRAVDLDPNDASTNNNLGIVLRQQGKIEEAIAVFQRAIDRDVNDASAHNNLGMLLHQQSKIEESITAFQRAINLDPNDASAHSNLGAVFCIQGRYVEAEPLYERALGLTEAQLGAEHPDTAKALNNLAGLYVSQGWYVEAESLYEQALRITEMTLGADHLQTATMLNNLAELYVNQGRYVEAEPLFERALRTMDAMLGADHPSMAKLLTSFAYLYAKLGRYDEAEKLYQQALAINIEGLGESLSDTTKSLDNVVELHESQVQDKKTVLLLNHLNNVARRINNPGLFPVTAEEMDELLKQVDRSLSNEELHEHQSAILQVKNRYDWLRQQAGIITTRQNQERFGDAMQALDQLINQGVLQLPLDTGGFIPSSTRRREIVEEYRSFVATKMNEKLWKAREDWLPTEPRQALRLLDEATELYEEMVDMVGATSERERQLSNQHTELRREIVEEYRSFIATKMNEKLWEAREDWLPTEPRQALRLLDEATKLYEEMIDMVGSASERERQLSYRLVDERARAVYLLQQQRKP